MKKVLGIIVMSNVILLVCTMKSRCSITATTETTMGKSTGSLARLFALSVSVLIVCTMQSRCKITATTDSAMGRIRKYWVTSSFAPSVSVAQCTLHIGSLIMKRERYHATNF